MPPTAVTGEQVCGGESPDSGDQLEGEQTDNKQGRKERELLPKSPENLE